MSNEITTKQISDMVEQMLRYVISQADAKKDDRSSSKALLAFLVRNAFSWRSIVVLLENVSDKYPYSAIGNDCAGILRCMYDAFLQAKYLISGIEDSEELGNLYIQFKTIELYDLFSSVVKQEDDLSKRVSNSQLREKGEPTLRKAYEKVKHMYPRGSKRRQRKSDKLFRTRVSWYQGELRSLAIKLDRESEYVWFIKKHNSSIHSGPLALFEGPRLTERDTAVLAEMIVCQVAALVVKHFSIDICQDYEELLVAYSKGLVIDDEE